MCIFYVCQDDTLENAKRKAKDIKEKEKKKDKKNSW